MSLTRLVCPHCEKTVTMQLTTVAQKRECPECGKTIILQFITYAGRTSAFKRRALLLPTETVEVVASQNDAVMLPRSLEGNIQARMLHDPEVKTSASMLKRGLIIVSSLVVIVIAGNLFNWWSEAAKGITVIKEKMTAPTAGIDPGAERDVLKPSTKPDYVDYSQKRPSSGANNGQGSSAVRPAPPEPPPINTGNTDTDSAIGSLKSFLEAKDLTERLNYVRDQEMMEPRMRRYYTDYPDGPIVYEKISQIGDAGSGLTYIFDVRLPTGEDRRAMVGKTVSGVYLVDWASFVIYSENKWADFIYTKSKEPRLFRVLAVKEEFFSGQFDDKTRLGCIKLIDPIDQTSMPLYAYYERGSILGRSMEFIMRQSLGEAVPLIVTLRYPAGDIVDDNQVWLEERIAEGWVTRGR